MKKINTLQDLKAEQKRLRMHQTFLEMEIRKDVANIKESLAPLALITSGAKKMLSSKNNSMVSDSAGGLVKFVAKNFLLKNSGLIARFLIPFLMQNVTSNIIEDNKSKIVDWVGNLVSKFSAKKPAESPIH